MKNESAFPAQTTVNGDSSGLTKREYFAALALMGTVVNPDRLDTRDLAKLAVDYADALIKELESR